MSTGRKTRCANSPFNSDEIRQDLERARLQQQEIELNARAIQNRSKNWVVTSTNWLNHFLVTQNLAHGRKNSTGCRSGSSGSNRSTSLRSRNSRKSRSARNTSIPRTTICVQPWPRWKTPLPKSTARPDPFQGHFRACQQGCAGTVPEVVWRWPCLPGADR